MVADGGGTQQELQIAAVVDARPLISRIINRSVNQSGGRGLIGTLLRAHFCAFPQGFVGFPRNWKGFIRSLRITQQNRKRYNNVVITFVSSSRETRCTSKHSSWASCNFDL